MKLFMSKRVEERVDVDWDSSMPLSLLPENIQKYFREHADFLHQDLEGRINTILTREPNRDGECSRFEGHKLRYVDERNPEWYSELYKEYDQPRPRKRRNSGLEKKEYLPFNQRNRKPKKRKTRFRSGKTLGVIKRVLSLEALDRIRDGRDIEYVERSRGFVPYRGRYDMIYRDLIYQHLTEGFAYDGIKEKPKRKVVDYFLGNGKK